MNKQIGMFETAMEDVITLKSKVIADESTNEIGAVFDYHFDGTTETEITVPRFPESFQIGLIVGSSGSGKSTLLRHCFADECENKCVWPDEKAIVSCFDSCEEAVEKLCAVGLCSIPSWCKPYSVLSTGEKFRADVARNLHNYSVIDEFTSVVNREVAKSCSNSVQKYIREKGLNNVVFASCHDDIIEYLRPDWIYNTDTLKMYDGRCLQRPPIDIEIARCTTNEWRMFKAHHYLSGEINKASRCVIARINNYPVAFVASLAYPSGSVKNGWREHRLVVLPDYQGIGIGNAVSEAVAQMYLDMGCRYFSKTANPRCGIHRDKSPLWRPTSHNHKARGDYLNDGIPVKINTKSMSGEMQIVHAGRICYAHEYIGRNAMA